MCICAGVCVCVCLSVYITEAYLALAIHSSVASLPATTVVSLGETTIVGAERSDSGSVTEMGRRWIAVQAGKQSGIVLVIQTQQSVAHTSPDMHNHTFSIWNYRESVKAIILGINTECILCFMVFYHQQIDSFSPNQITQCCKNMLGWYVNWQVPYDWQFESLSCIIKTEGE